MEQPDKMNGRDKVATYVDSIRVLIERPVGNERCLETHCFDYHEYYHLPNAVRYEGRVYCLTGWNSDIHRAYYKTGQSVAYPIE